MSSDGKKQTSLSGWLANSDSKKKTKKSPAVSSRKNSYSSPPSFNKSSTQSNNLPTNLESQSSLTSQTRVIATARTLSALPVQPFAVATAPTFRNATTPLPRVAATQQDGNKRHEKPLHDSHKDAAAPKSTEPTSCKPAANNIATSRSPLRHLNNTKRLRSNEEGDDPSMPPLKSPRCGKRDKSPHTHNNNDGAKPPSPETGLIPEHDVIVVDDLPPPQNQKAKNACAPLAKEKLSGSRDLPLEIDSSFPFSSTGSHLSGVAGSSTVGMTKQRREQVVKTEHATPHSTTHRAGPKIKTGLGTRDLPLEIESSSGSETSPTNSFAGGLIDLTDSMDESEPPATTRQVAIKKEQSTPKPCTSQSSTVISKVLPKYDGHTTATVSSSGSVVISRVLPKYGGGRSPTADSAVVEPRTVKTEAPTVVYSQVLKVGEPCAVFIHKDGERDAYGRLVMDSWQRGTVKNVTGIAKKSRQETNKVLVLLETEETVTATWTRDKHSEVQRLIKTPGGTEHLEMDPSICFTPAPHDLNIGDAVLSWFQRGEGDFVGSMFSGRVAKVEGDRCTVAYDDGDWESNIPYKKAEPRMVLTRFSKGWEQPQWMEGMQLSSRQSRRSKKRKAIVHKVEPMGSVWLKYEGQEKLEKCSYQAIVQCIMNEARDKAETSFQWKDTPRSKARRRASKNSDSSHDPSVESTLNDSPRSEALENSFMTLTTGVGSNDMSFRLSLGSSTSNDTPMGTPLAKARPTRRKRSAPAVTAAAAPPKSSVDIQDNKKPRRTTRRSNANSKDSFTKLAETVPLIVSTCPANQRQSTDSLVSHDLEGNSPKNPKQTVERKRPTRNDKWKSNIVPKEKSGDQKNKNAASSADGHNAKKPSQRPTRRSSRKASLSASEKLAALSGEDTEDDEKPMATKIESDKATVKNSELLAEPQRRGRSRSERPVPSATSQAKRTLPGSGKAVYVDHECIPEADDGEAFKWQWPVDEKESSAVKAVPETRPEISTTFASSLDRAWKSSECHVAADLMSHALSHHGLAQNQSLRQATNTLLLKGPQVGKSNKVSFPDCQRMDLLNEVVSRVDFSWYDFWEQMSSDLYTVTGDNRRMNKFAIQRIATSAHAKAIAARKFLEEARASYPCAPQSWVKEIRSNTKGPRDAFQSAIATVLSLWTSYGHFYFGTKWTIDDVLPDTRVFVQRNIRQLLQDLGKILSYAGQIYGVEEGQKPSSLAHFWSERVQSKMQDFDLPDELRGPQPLDQYKDKMLLRMLLDLDRKVIPGVRPLVASQLNIASEYNMIFS